MSAASLAGLLELGVNQCSKLITASAQLSRSVLRQTPAQNDATDRSGGLEATIQPPQSTKTSFDWLPLQHGEHRAAQNTIVLCHGLGFFDKTPEALPRFQLHYWGSIVDALRKLGNDVVIARVPSTGTIAERGRALHAQLKERLPHGARVNLLAHSMGGLDCRHLITHLQPTHFKALSLTTLSCPHRGSPFMDWCRDYLGLGRIIPRLSDANKESTTPATEANSPIEEESFILKHTAVQVGQQIPLSSAILTKTMLAKTIDCPAYANLTTAYCNKVFNPHTPDSSEVKYYSFAASTPSKFPLWHPLYLPHQVVSEKEGKTNDGLVSLESAKWGEYIGTVPCDHWELRGRGLPGAKFNVDEFYRSISTLLCKEGF